MNEKKRHWAEEAYDSAATSVVTASAPQTVGAGAIEDLLAEEYNIGPDRREALIRFALQEYMRLTDPFLQVSGAQPKIDAIYSSISPGIRSEVERWERDEGTSPFNPAGSMAFAREPVSQVGINQADQVRRAITDMIYQLVYNNMVASGDGKQSNLGWYDAYKVDELPYTSAYKNFLPLEDFTNMFPVRKYDATSYNPDPRSVIGSEADPVVDSTFANVYRDRAHHIAFANSLLGPPYRMFGGDHNVALNTVTNLLAAWTPGNQPITTSYNGVVQDEAGYAYAKSAFEGWALGEIE